MQRQVERTELESRLSQLEKRLEKVRGHRFRRRPGRDYDEDGAMICDDIEGAAVFEIVVELNKVWTRLEALDRARFLPLERLPTAPKPQTRPPQPEPPRFQLPENWEQTARLLQQVFALDLAGLPRADLRELHGILDRRGLAAFELWKFFEASACQVRDTMKRVEAELKARPFDVLQGAGLVDDEPREPPHLVLVEQNDTTMKS